MTPGLAICSSSTPLQQFGEGLIPPSIPRFQGSRTTAAGRRSAAVWSSRRMRRPSKICSLALLNGTSRCNSKSLLAELQVERLAENLEIFLDVVVALRGPRDRDLCQHRLEFPAFGELIGKSGVRNAVIEFGQALLRPILGGVLEVHVEQHAGVRQCCARSKICRRRRRPPPAGPWQAEPSQAEEGQRVKRRSTVLPRSTVAFFFLGCREIGAVYARDRAAGTRLTPASVCVSTAPADSRALLLRNFAASLQARGFVLAARRTAPVFMVFIGAGAYNCSRWRGEPAGAAQRRIEIASLEARVPPDSSGSWSRSRRRARGWRGAPGLRPWRVWSAVTSSAPQSHRRISCLFPGFAVLPTKA